MFREYMFFFDPKTTFKHHIDILLTYVHLNFPELVLSMFDNYTLIIGDGSKYKHLSIRWEHSGQREYGAIVQYIIEFVSGDPNDTFSMQDRILDHGWYDAVAIS